MTTVNIKANLEAVQTQINDACARANRKPDAVTLVAVSKTKPQAHILAAIESGVIHFGENRVEEASEKIPAVNAQVETKPTWHMIGHIQSRKAKLITPIFDMVHSVDRLKIAEKLSELAAAENRTLPILVEVNISGEEAKHGFDASGWKNNTQIKETFWRDMQTLIALPNLDVRGFMTMAPFYDEAERTRPVFAGLAELRDEIQADLKIILPDLSMGMTNDYSIAIEEGATIVRIGRAIFGER